MDNPKRFSGKFTLVFKIFFFAALAVAILFTAMSGVFSNFDLRNFEAPTDVQRR